MAPLQARHRLAARRNSPWGRFCRSAEWAAFDAERQGSCFLPTARMILVPPAIDWWGVNWWITGLRAGGWPLPGRGCTGR